MKFTIFKRAKVDRCKAFRRYLAVALLIEFLFLAAYTPYTGSALNIAENLASHMHFWVRLKEDRFIDWMMNMYKGVETKDEKQNLWWINIDDATFNSWNSPDSVQEKINREKLSTLIPSIIEFHPALIVVDVGLRPREEIDDKDNDDDLINKLANEVSSSEDVPIILTRNFNNTKIENNLNEIKNIYWALPIFHEEADGKIRRFKLWEPVIPENGDEVIPSIPLLANALTKKDKGEVGKECDFHHPTPICFYSKSLQKTTGGSVVGDIFHRIIYRFPWNNAGITSPPLTMVSAKNFNEKKDEYKKKIKNEIVIIGGSYKESKDFRETPLGRMPGCLVIANAIHSLQIENDSSLPWWAIILALTGTVLLIALAFSQYGPFRGMLISFVAIGISIVCTMYILSDNLLIFRNGVPFTFAIALSIVGLLYNIPIGNVNHDSEEVNT